MTNRLINFMMYSDVHPCKECAEFANDFDYVGSIMPKVNILINTIHYLSKLPNVKLFTKPCTAFLWVLRISNFPSLIHHLGQKCNFHFYPWHLFPVTLALRAWTLCVSDCELLVKSVWWRLVNSAIMNKVAYIIMCFCSAMTYF